MPLARYGVLAGSYNRFERDPPVNYGNFYHGLLYVNAPLPGQQTPVEWRCALDVKAPDLNAPLEDRDLGGLGIHLVRSLMDHVSYSRDEDKNVLTVRKRIR